ncbi:16S rRNA (cytosine(1402)-N(4))-methyltransferase RsmH [Pelagibacteraceae bacterium]|nr:16S rRNA (cytosine(1402)-N(4))-methyltransferase RsmH [Pelagibacteraceae bacterium]
MNISLSSLEKNHFPVMLDEVIQICNHSKKKKLVIDCTFGGGGYTKALLKFSNIKVIALDRDRSAIKRANSLKAKSSNQFKFYNEKFSNLDRVVSSENKPDVIIFDLGLSTFQLRDYKRGFSFNAKEKIDMQMGLSDISAEEVINTVDEKNLKLILKVLGEEQEANKIVRNIIKARQIKKINTVTDLVRIIKLSKKKNYNQKINVCTKTFQALRIFVNKETSELIEGLIKATQHVKRGGKIITISFHSIEDKIIKYYFTNYSSSKSNPSRYMPSQSNQKNLFFEKYKNNFLRPSEEEIIKNPASRSAKLRQATRSDQAFNYPIEFKEKFKKYLEIENDTI